jgi:hypothetical protein
MEPKKYKKKPVVIEAVQLTWPNWNVVCEFVSKEAFGGGIYLEDETLEPTTKEFTHTLGLWIETLEGRMLAKQGDYIIKGIKGEFYPCKPDIFDQTYDEVILTE